MEADLRTRLLGAAAVAAIVATRVTWGDRPQGKTLPAIILLMVSAGREYHHGGADELHETRVQVDCWATSHLQATQLGAAVVAELETAETVGSTEFGKSLLAAERDVQAESLDGGGTAYRRSLDFMVWWRAA